MAGLTRLVMLRTELPVSLRAHFIPRYDSSRLSIKAYQNKTSISSHEGLAPRMNYVLNSKLLDPDPFMRLISTLPRPYTIILQFRVSHNKRPFTSNFNHTRKSFSTSQAVHSPKTVMSDSSVEAAKRAAAQQAVKDHFDPKSTHVGIGSGTTIVYVVEAIKERSTNPSVLFVPTGWQSRDLVQKAGLQPISFDSLPEHVLLDVAFDGADEVDSELNCIKGGGACLFQ